MSIITKNPTKSKRPGPPAVYPENVPEKLAAGKHWLNWCWYWDGKNWKKATHKWAAPENRTTLQEALARIGKEMNIYINLSKTWERHPAAGVGLAINNNPLVCIDFDNSINDDGTIKTEAEKVLSLMPISFVEISPSGTGLHGYWLLGKEDKARFLDVHRLYNIDTKTKNKKYKAGKKFQISEKEHTDIEFYLTGHWFAFTADIWQGRTDFNRVSLDELEAAWNYLESIQIKKEPAAVPAAAIQTASSSAGEVLTDDEVIRLARKSKRDGLKFAALFDRGDATAYGGDFSRADMALVNILYYFTTDVDQVRRLFEQSALWNMQRPHSKSAGYVDHTISTVATKWNGQHYSKDWYQKEAAKDFHEISQEEIDAAGSGDAAGQMIKAACALLDGIKEPTIGSITEEVLEAAAISQAAGGVFSNSFDSFIGRAKEHKGPDKIQLASFRSRVGALAQKKKRDIRAAADKGAGVSFEWPVLDSTSNNFKPLAAAVENTAYLLNYCGVKLAFNELSNQVEATGRIGKFEGRALVSPIDNLVTAIRSTAGIYGMNISRDDAGANAVYLARANTYSPIKEYLRKCHDTWKAAEVKEGYIEELFECLVLTKEAAKNREFCYLMFRKWLISAVVMAFNDSMVNNARGVLVLAGRQNIGKTRFIKNLVPDEGLIGGWVKEGVRINPDSKDSIMQACKHWIIELGEFDGIIKKTDVTALKNFVSQSSDEYRIPYERGSVIYPRRMVAYATVNKDEYLRDDTGESRWWSIGVEGIKPYNKEHLALMWGEVLAARRAGEVWYMDGSEVKNLEKINKSFKEYNSEQQRVLDQLNWEAAAQSWQWQTVSQLCDSLGIDRRQTANVGRALAALAKDEDSMIEMKRNNRQKIYKLPPVVVSLGPVPEEW